MDLNIDRIARFMRTNGREDCAEILGKLSKGEITNEEATWRVDHLEAKALLANPPVAHEYPNDATEHWREFRKIPHKDRTRPDGKPNYDLPMTPSGFQLSRSAIIYGRDQHAAWYRKVLEDFEIYVQTIRGVGLDNPVGKRLASQLRDLAQRYMAEPVVWFLDHSIDGLPASAPAAYNALAKRWILASLGK
jgi:hypothetical protein